MEGNRGKRPKTLDSRKKPKGAAFGSSSTSSQRVHEEIAHERARAKLIAIPFET